MKDSLARAVKDTTKRILQNKYDVRGYEQPVQITKKTRKNTLKI